MSDKQLKQQINGKKVFLRFVTHNDFEELLEMFQESRRFYRGLVTPPLDLEKFTIYVDRNKDAANECFVICRKSDGKIIGIINLTQIFRKAFQNAYLGYALGVKYTGHGYMSEAVGVVLKYAFKTLKLHRVEANVQPGNIASLNVLKQAGFTKEGFSRRYIKIDGRWRDHERWAIIVEDWSKKK